MNTLPDTQAQTSFAPQQIVFRCQAPGDHAKLEQVCPKDQTRLFRGEWDGFRFLLNEVPAPAAATPAPDAGAAEASIEFRAQHVAAVRREWARVAAMTDEEIRTLAERSGLSIDPKVGKEAIVDLIVAKGGEVRPPAGDAVVGDGNGNVSAAAGPSESADATADRAKLKAMDDANLRTEAAERKVPWEKKASRETMIDRLVAAGPSSAAK